MTKTRIEVSLRLNEWMTIDEIILELDRIKKITPALKLELEYGKDLTFYKQEGDDE